jgi:hypothetical protein
MELVGGGAALAVVALLGAGVLAVAVAAAARRLPAKLVATRIDRASGLADRLGTALDFGERAGDGELHPDTRALMLAAISDGLAAVPRADVRAASPIRAPRDLRALCAFGAVAGLVALLSFGPHRAATTAAAGSRAPGASAAAAPVESLDPDDLDYQRQFVEDMRELAEQTRDPALAEMTRELEALLDKAEKGEIGKQELIARMEALEKSYSQSTIDDIEAVLADLKDQGKQLKKNSVTRELGEALEKGDLDAARKELEELAEKVDQGELSPKEKKQLADALDKAAESQEQKEARAERQREAQARETEQKIAKKREEIRRLQRKLDEQPQNEEARRTLSREKRELDRLEREQQQQRDKPKRRLDRLSRNMKNAAESLRQKNEKQSAEDMRQAAGETQKMQDELRKLANQKKVRSQLGDLKEAIRRAKPRRGGRSGQQQARAQRIQEWERRAGGQRGNAQAWRPGQGQPDPQGQGKESQLGRQQQQSQQWGDQPGGDPMGDPTERFGKTKDERLTGVQGSGPSRRETILTSARKGFAQTGYRNVYVDYKKVAEEVMSQEKVPQGYKYYVKRYFQRIKPHSMD